MSAADFIPLAVAVLQSISQLSRNPVVRDGNPDAGSTLNQVGDLLDIATDLIGKGEAAVDELRVFNSIVQEIKTSGRSITQQERDDLKARSDAAHAGLQDLKRQAAERNVASPENLKAAGDAAARNFKANKAADQTLLDGRHNETFGSSVALANKSKINPTVPGAAELIRKQKGNQ